MNNAKLTFEQMKDMIQLFVSNKLNNLKIGDFEINKSYYVDDKVSSSDKTALSLEDPLYYSAGPQLPPEVIELLTNKR